MTCVKSRTKKRLPCGRRFYLCTYRPEAAAAMTITMPQKRMIAAKPVANLKKVLSKMPLMP